MVLNSKQYLANLSFGEINRPENLYRNSSAMSCVIIQLAQKAYQKKIFLFLRNFVPLRTYQQIIFRDKSYFNNHLIKILCWLWNVGFNNFVKHSDANRYFKDIKMEYLTPENVETSVLTGRNFVIQQQCFCSILVLICQNFCNSWKNKFLRICWLIFELLTHWKEKSHKPLS